MTSATCHPSAKTRRVAESEVDRGSAVGQSRGGRPISHSCPKGSTRRRPAGAREAALARPGLRPEAPRRAGATGARSEHAGQPPVVRRQRHRRARLGDPAPAPTAPRSQRCRRPIPGRPTSAPTGPARRCGRRGPPQSRSTPSTGPRANSEKSICAGRREGRGRACGNRLDSSSDPVVTI